MKTGIKLNSKLSKLNFFSSLADFLFFFSVLQLTQKVNQSISFAAYSIGIRAAAIALSGVTYPHILNIFGNKKALYLSQLLSCLLIFLLGILDSTTFNLNYTSLYTFLFLNTLCFEYFKSSRETYSKNLPVDKSSDRNFQAQLMNGFFAAQLLAPLLSFFVIKSIPTRLTLFIASSLSFYSFVNLFKLPALNKTEIVYSFFKPFKYLVKNKNLLHIFYLRTLGFWIPAGIADFLIFPLLEERFGLGVEYVTFFYTAVGLGSFFASTILKDSTFINSESIHKIHEFLIRKTDAWISGYFFFFLAVSRLCLVFAPNFVSAVVALFLAGISNGMCAISSQSLRRKITTTDQFPEIVGLELFIASGLMWAVSTTMLYIKNNNIYSTNSLLLLSIALVIVQGFAYLSGKLKDFK